MLCMLYPTIPLLPSQWVEKVWLRHILDTQEYDLDCQCSGVGGQEEAGFLHYSPDSCSLEQVTVDLNHE